MLLLTPLCAVAQQVNTAPSVGRVASAVPGPRSEWLGSFSGIRVNGVMQVHIIKNAAEEGPRIKYDTKGEASPKFRAAVDKNGILRIEEPADAKRTTVTEVTVWCNDIASLSVTGADLTCENLISCQMFDLEISGGANVKATFDVQDLAVEATGRSRAVIDGSARYFRLNISTAKFDGSGLSTVSSIVSASHASEVQVSASERLEAETATAAMIIYDGNPAIIRTRTSLFGGEIVPLEK